MSDTWLSCLMHTEESLLDSLPGTFSLNKYIVNKKKTKGKRPFKRERIINPNIVSSRALVLSISNNLSFLVFVPTTVNPCYQRITNEERPLSSLRSDELSISQSILNMILNGSVFYFAYFSSTDATHNKIDLRTWRNYIPIARDGVQ
ncbi:uncharacterized protein LOC127136484 [Lathyrus oleraceus]|uniref:uncharacterized protein LOC127136484 n=1 Tax=Pisum sativum TaxID=3888 RepID=UPI0021D08EDA|nr:uncharacterized protein LOC127136484 [Pisum sativum]